MPANQVDPIDEARLRDLYFNATTEELVRLAAEVTLRMHGDKILLRGLIEFSNHCSQKCHYCGIRGGNKKVRRFRMSPDEVVAAAMAGFEKGIRTFVLQSGEDNGFGVDQLVKVVTSIKQRTDHHCAITLSCGLLAHDQLAALKQAGADRYLLRFETADPQLHARLRPGHTLAERLTMLADLRLLGYQVGSGFMVGLPGETDETRIQNLLLCGKMGFDMVGIGPFIPHADTPLGDAPQHPLELGLRQVSLLRLVLPAAHIPATTAAGSIDPTGREQMISAGANVLMPNLTPVRFKPDYLLYPGKICLNESGEKCIGCMSLRVRAVNRVVDFSRGDALWVGGDGM